ncbi:PHP domain-containing protein [Deferrisoma camini]|uniref:PHP domain-containing protein n=1 Tax=Deferrisoma camini TaxID=1035120 RepID=UPI00046CFC46|nr:PHP domain-containing protein [Deferrisoma camini]
MRIQADLHVHTVASGHAFSTVAEIAREARSRGLRAVGLADHGPALPGGPHLYHFSALRFLPRVMDGVRILRGVEANPVNARGDLDLPDPLLARLDFAIVGFHEGCGLKASNPRKNTRVLIAAMAHPRVRILGHPGNPAFPVDVGALVAAARDRGVALEINNASFVNARKGSLETCHAIAAEAARMGAMVCLSSDAHVAQQVGEVSEAWRVASAAGVRPEQVVNRTWDTLVRFLELDPAEFETRPGPYR